MLERAEKKDLLFHLRGRRVKVWVNHEDAGGVLVTSVWVDAWGAWDAWGCMDEMGEVGMALMKLEGMTK